MGAITLLLTALLFPPESDGGLDKDIISRVVRAHIGEVRYCYSEALEGDPDLSGKIEVSFTIERDGTVDDASVVETDFDEGVPDCIESAVERWKFPKSHKDTTVTYPFMFSPG